MGQSTFHAAGVALATGLPTYVLDPYFAEVRDVTEFAASLRKKATLAVYRAAEAESFGVIVGLRDGQMSKTAGLRIKKELEAAGKKVQLIALTDITADALRRFTGIDAFVQAACPRISTDKPVRRARPVGAAVRRAAQGHARRGAGRVPPVAALALALRASGAILPNSPLPPSIRACASAARSRGYAESMTARSLPRDIQYSPCSSSARVPCVEPSMLIPSDDKRRRSVRTS